MKIDIKITETLSRIVSVKADSVDEAINKVKDKYNNEKIILDYSDFDGNVIFEENIDNLDSKKDFLINEVIKYLIKDEKKHFEEMNEPSNHIYLKLLELKKYL
ncbi:MAG: DpnD/PcfM family protein [Candidatus Marinarcus sp.]|uniref:DpnD/PcfM family protein n=1 Tax=Candidatus Marinarcus sp. TaxID=3100987 RepID=UPI003B004E97